MKKLIYLSLFCLTSFNVINAQEAVISASGSYSNSNLSLTYTLGECITETFSKSSKVLTQGFNQASITVLTLKEDVSESLTITAYPNPVIDKIKIVVSENNEDKISYRLFGLGGNILSEGKLFSTEYEISLALLPPTAYILKIYKDNSEIKTFKIIKQR